MYPSPYGMPAAPPPPPPPLPGPRPETVNIATWIQFGVAGLVVVQAVFQIISLSRTEYYSDSAFSAAVMGSVISTLISVALIISVALMTRSGVNGWRVAGTVCASLAVLGGLTSMTSLTVLPSWALGVGSHEGDFIIINMVLTGLHAAAAIATIMLWWSSASSRWFDGWSAVRRFAQAYNSPVPPIS